MPLALKSTRRHGCKLADIVAGGEHVAFATDEQDTDGGIALRRFHGVGQRAVHRIGQRVLLVGPRHRQAQDPVTLLDLDMLGHSSSPLGNLVCMAVSQRATTSISASLNPSVRRALTSTSPAFDAASAVRPAGVSQSRHARPSSGSARRLIRFAAVIRSTSPLMPGGPRSSAAPASPIRTPSRWPRMNSNPDCAAVTPLCWVRAAIQRCSLRCATLSRNTSRCSRRALISTKLIYFARELIMPMPAVCHDDSELG